MTGPGEVAMVTGGAGFLGQHIVKLLQEKDDNIIEIRVFDIKSYPDKPEYRGQKPIRCIQGDIRNYIDILRALDGVDVVFHCACLISGGLFPDLQGMYDTNVKGTENLIAACKENNVKKLIYTSTVDLMVGFDEIINGDETSPLPDKFLFPGLPETKYKAELLVLGADHSPLPKGNGAELLTFVLRPNVMYGEEDPHYVTAGITTALKNRGVMPKVGNGQAVFQQAYVGNVAWAHVVANKTLSKDPTISGNICIITDDTPLMNMFQFIEIFLKARGLALSHYCVPYSFAHCLMYTFESMLRLIHPLYEFNPEANLSGVIYSNTTIYFNRKKAESMLKYQPLHDFKESLSQCLAYYKQWNPVIQ